jgi:hypothetical protein
MLTQRHYRRPNPDRRRALELLAASRQGYGKAILRAHGFSIDMMVELVKAGLATTKRERTVAGGRETTLCACGSQRPAGKPLQRCPSRITQLQQPPLVVVGAELDDSGTKPDRPRVSGAFFHAIGHRRAASFTQTRNPRSGQGGCLRRGLLDLAFVMGGSANQRPLKP